jgi:hypothetical protein
VVHMGNGQAAERLQGKHARVERAHNRRIEASPAACVTRGWQQAAMGLGVKL